MITVKRLLVWGGGGHGKVVAEAARAAGLEVVGFIDRDEGKRDMLVDPGGARVVINEHALCSLIDDRSPLPLGATGIALAIGDNVLRMQAAAHAGPACAEAIVHPSAAVSPHSSLGRGTVVLAVAVINAAATIGLAVIVNSGAIVEHDCIIGDGAHISPGAVLCGGASVGRLAWVGAGATVLPGVRIGERAIVGAGAVVLRDVADGTTVVGNPAAAIGHSVVF